MAFSSVGGMTQRYRSLQQPQAMPAAPAGTGGYMPSSATQPPGPPQMGEPQVGAMMPPSPTTTTGPKSPWYQSLKQPATPAPTAPKTPWYKQGLPTPTPVTKPTIQQAHTAYDTAKENAAKQNPITPTASPVSTAMRGETYLPGSDPRLTSAMNATDKAGAAVQGYDRNAMQTGNESRYRSLYGNGQVSADASLMGAPDRTALAMQKLKDFDATSQETRFNEERDLGRNIAKFGRSGLQANADNFGDITRKISADRGRLANELAYNVADGDINDRFRKLDFQTGLDERNMDRSFDRTNAALDRAGSQTDREVGDYYDQFNAAGSLEDRVFGQGESNRNEFRTERGRQDSQAQQTIENRLREFEIQQQLEDAKIRRAALLAQAGGA